MFIEPWNIKSPFGTTRDSATPIDYGWNLSGVYISQEGSFISLSVADLGEQESACQTATLTPAMVREVAAKLLLLADTLEAVR